MPPFADRFRSDGRVRPEGDYRRSRPDWPLSGSKPDLNRTQSSARRRGVAALHPPSRQPLKRADDLLSLDPVAVLYLTQRAQVHAALDLGDDALAQNVERQSIKLDVMSPYLATNAARRVSAFLVRSGGRL